MPNVNATKLVRDFMKFMKGEILVKRLDMWLVKIMNLLYIVTILIQAMLTRNKNKNRASG